MSITLSPLPDIEHPVRNPIRTRTEFRWPAAVGILWAGIVASIAGIVWQSMTAREITMGGFVIDRLTVVFLLLVMSVGAASLRFSVKYLLGEPGSKSFRAYLLATVMGAAVFMAASDLRVVLVAWLVVSMGLHKLLTYYSFRAETRRPAAKKFVISRIGDLLFIVAITAIVVQYGTYSIVDVNRLAAHSGQGAVDAIALLIVVAALTKSAQFPFHSWLPETMEAPTPVSALMHAGVINAGGVLLLRFAPLLVHAQAAMYVLVVVGTVTVAIGTLSMWAQPAVKQKLAWSTVNQMGYMMIEIGLGAFSIAALHIVGHGFYKAWSFLSSGSAGQKKTSRSVTPLGRACALCLGTVASAALVSGIASKSGIDILHAPVHFALLSILAMAIGQSWVAGAEALRSRTATVGMLIAGGTVLASYAAVVVDRMLEGYFATSLPAPVHSTDLSTWLIALLPVAVIGSLGLAYTLLPEIVKTRHGRALHVHSLHGFYCGIITDRCIARTAAWAMSIRAAGDYSIQLQGSTGR